MSISKGTQGLIYIIGSVLAFNAEATTEGVGSTMIYQIDNATKRVFDPNTVITASTGTIDTSWQDEGIDYYTGRVKMTASGLGALTLGGSSVSLLKLLGYVYGWTLAVTKGMANVTCLGDLWRKMKALGTEVTLTLSRYRFDCHELDDLATEEDFVLFKLYEDGSNGFWMKALKSDLGVTKTVGDAVDDEAITMEISSVVGRIA